jgi:hypothetical protein
MRTRTLRLAAALLAAASLAAASAGAGTPGTVKLSPWGPVTPDCPTGVWACGPAV